jgi:hypothetical protein
MTHNNTKVLLMKVGERRNMKKQDQIDGKETKLKALPNTNNGLFNHSHE